jgi:hypothetical protein
MTKPIKAGSTVANKETRRNCWTWLAMLQIALAVLLVTAAAVSYWLMHHPALMIPAIMGAALLFLGAKAFLVCHDRPLFRDHQHPNNGITG